MDIANKFVSYLKLVCFIVLTLKLIFYFTVLSLAISALHCLNSSRFTSFPSAIAFLQPSNTGSSAAAAFLQASASSGAISLGIKITPCLSACSKSPG
ncbi:MAG: hypothetical protein PWP27_2543 [Clostridiales bacterium]|jgi:hypothetical protein|nr:hypothetical protein [Clostridiales bacterium]MDK2934733.1 hypothetical protein [Clostridiales bacterium]